MKHPNSNLVAGYVMFIVISILAMSACDRNASPEGRMSIKLEDLQKEMIDSLKQQNRAILDSLGKIREDLNEIKQLKN